MSFIKAKIKRFNDVEPCTPSPADYNVPVATKPKNAVIPQSERFLEPKSPCVSEIGSVKSTPIFRTPTLPKIKKFLKPLSATKTSKKELFTKTSAEIEALKEKIVECENKDFTIKELREELDELQEKISDLTNQITEFNTVKEKAETQIANLIKQHNEDVKSINDKYEDELHSLLNEKNNLEFDLVEHKTKLQQFELIQTEQNMEIEKLQNEHKTKIQDIEFELLKTMSNLQRENDTVAAKLIEIEVLKAQIAEKEKEEVRNALEVVVIKSELEKTEQNCNEIQFKYNSLLNEHNQLNSLKHNLEVEFSKVVVELNETRSNLSEDLNQKQNLIEQLLKEKRTYEYTINKTQETIEVLKRRLLNSDRDVEQLKHELALADEQMLQLEVQLAEVQTKNDHEECTKIDEEQINKLKNELLAQANELFENNPKKELFNEILSQLHQQMLLNKNAYDLIEKEIKLHDELDVFYDKEAEWKQFKDEFIVDKKLLEDEIALKSSEISDLTKQLIQWQEKCESYYQHFEYYRSKVLEYEREIDESDEINKKYIEQSGRYDKLLQKYELLEMEKAEQQNILDKKSSNLNEIEKKYDSLLEKFKLLEQENEKNKIKLNEQEKLIGPFKSQLEAYESEREVLLNQKNFMQNEAHEMSIKYADILGHQNNKQKIKHLRDIKMKNEELIQSKLDLEAKLCSQSKIIEKLKKENVDLKKLKKFINPIEDKENFSSPNRSLNSSRIDSPLRERN